MKEKYYKVSESELIDLIICRRTIQCGIYGWLRRRNCWMEWYGDCINHYVDDFIEEHGLTDEDIDKYENGFDYREMAEILIKNYEEIKTD